MTTREDYVQETTRQHTKGTVNLHRHEKEEIKCEKR